MRNLWLFLIKNYAFFLFLGLEITSITLLINGNNFQRSSFINSANNVAGNWYNSVNEINDYLALSIVNDSLATENARLKNELKSTFYASKVDSGNITDTLTNNDTLTLKQYKYIIAKVINNSIIKRNNYLTLNRGSLHGIEKNMGVICSNGIVGIIKEVSPHFCTVISLLHKDIKISAQTVSTHDFGSLVWDGSSPRTAQLIDIPNHATIKKKDRVVTTSFSSIFPEGIMIGIVDNASIKTGDNFYSIDVELSTPFEHLEYVYVIDNRMANEQLQLEEDLKYD
jgi:rod shape-determining protein MreC